MVKYIGVNDRKIDLFEGQFVVPEGVSYNSYLILDEKIAVMDTVDINFKDEFLANLEKALDGRKPDYLIVDHMEPDHSASIKALVDKYPNIEIVGNQTTFKMINQFFPGFTFKQVLVKEGDKLSLGKHNLSFIFAPMVHWPEVMMTYDSYDKCLYSADAFGKFGALDFDDPEGWACEARRYYFGIVGKFGVNVQNLFKKLPSIDLEIIRPLHGPVLTAPLDEYIRLYDIWSKYEPEADAVTIAYTSVYGNTRNAVNLLKDNITKDYDMFDLARDDFHEAIEGAFENKYLVLATTTYCSGIFPKMLDFLHALKERGYQNRTIAIIENGSWAPQAKKLIVEFIINNFKNIRIIEKTITIKSALTEENKKEIIELASELNK
ncbi:flavorubredoxin [Anaeroplasma bactoclasticum]|jgi:flavorubredoxin|uniref:Flavorubredoxin n=1 Tax=Anaeroplasma bactoclasticum TaxID=2088 RepID=A0A397RHY2_9MOLU|nr:FprA family A-type flavoprotein [Anaeroplasma bactoclasticum]RIA73950.1 flavorubredoxin [Anaeroplasma bactoclasticum]